VQLRVHLVLAPEVLLEALHPLEVRDDDAARVREHVGQDEDAPVLEDRVGRGRHGAVRALADHRRLDPARVVLGHDLLEAAGREDVARELEQLLVRDLVHAAEPAEDAVLLLVRERGGDVDAFRVVDAAARVRDRHDLRALRMEQAREVRADVPEALDGDRVLGDPLALLPGERLDAVERAARRRLRAPERAADRERLTGHDAEDGVALVHRVGVEDPGHDATVRADVGRGDVPLRPDVVDDLARVAPRHALELRVGQGLGVADDAALGAAEREAHQRALPRHPHRQRLDLVQRDVRVVADPALRRPARDVVGHAVAAEHLDRPVVHLHRDRDLDRLLRLRENLDQVGVEREDLADPAQLRLGQLVGVLAEVGDRLSRAHPASPPRSFAGASI
jgi:hypothetical protein